MRVPVVDGDIIADVAGPSPREARGVIVFLHGWSLDRRMWALQLAAFASDYHCIAIDRRGFGRSTAPPQLAAESGDVAAILDHAGADRAVIVGMSQAGRIAADFALRRAQRVVGLVLQGARLGAAAPQDMEQEIPVADYAAAVRAGRLAEMKALWRAHPLMRTDNVQAASMIDAILSDYDARDLILGAGPAPEIALDALAALRIPSLVITGDEDTPLRRELADDLAGALPHSTRVEIAGAGHLCNVSAPADYNSALLSFIGRVST